MSSVLQRGDAVELKTVLDQRNKVLSGTKLFPPQPSTPKCDIKGTSKAAESPKESNSKSPKIVGNNTKNTFGSVLKQQTVSTRCKKLVKTYL